MTLNTSPEGRKEGCRCLGDRGLGGGRNHNSNINKYFRIRLYAVRELNDFRSVTLGRSPSLKLLIAWRRDDLRITQKNNVSTWPSPADESVGEHIPTPPRNKKTKCKTALLPDADVCEATLCHTRFRSGQILTLINGDRIPLTNSMSLLFEVSAVYRPGCVAGPATAVRTVNPVESLTIGCTTEHQGYMECCL